MAAGTTARGGAARLASLLLYVGMAVVALLVVFVVLSLLDANFRDNVFASSVRDLVGYVDLGMYNLFSPADKKLGVILNYGVAAVIWFVITRVVVRLVRRVA